MNKKKQYYLYFEICPVKGRVEFVKLIDQGRISEERRWWYGKYEVFKVPEKLFKTLEANLPKSSFIVSWNDTNYERMILFESFDWSELKLIELCQMTSEAGRLWSYFIWWTHPPKMPPKRARIPIRSDLCMYLYYIKKISFNPFGRDSIKIRRRPKK